jgi:hypothetical protein
MQGLGSSALATVTFRPGQAGGIAKVKNLRPSIVCMLGMAGVTLVHVGFTESGDDVNVTAFTAFAAIDPATETVLGSAHDF